MQKQRPGSVKAGLGASRLPRVGKQARVFHVPTLPVSIQCAGWGMRVGNGMRYVRVQGYGLVCLTLLAEGRNVFPVSDMWHLCFCLCLACGTVKGVLRNRASGGGARESGRNGPLTLPDSHPRSYRSFTLVPTGLSMPLLPGAKTCLGNGGYKGIVRPWAKGRGAVAVGRAKC